MQSRSVALRQSLSDAAAKSNDTLPPMVTSVTSATGSVVPGSAAPRKFVQAQFAGLSSAPLVPPIHAAFTGIWPSHVIASDSGTQMYASSPISSPATSAPPPSMGVTRLALTRSRKPTVPSDLLTGT